ncbi:MAG TPA: ABC transporter substrate-binding protein [Gammaproteobacteria bacterium]|nr:ABC transporter substrate-binding protein [Gammaproteobacteria bacterium]
MLKTLNMMLKIMTLGTLLAFSTQGSAELSPTQTVQESVDQILALLKDDALDQEERRAKIRTHINTRFDFKAMSQRTLATNWKKASEQEREKFIDLFSQLIENTYIGKIELYTDEKVEYPGEKVKGRKAVVETLIIAASADIPVDYRLYKKDDVWWVYDVIIEGVSLVSNYRSSYQEIVKKEGFEGLLAKMQEKIDELQSAPAPAEPVTAS